MCLRGRVLERPWVKMVIFVMVILPFLKKKKKNLSNKSDMVNSFLKVLCF